MRSERIARFLVIGLILGLILAVGLARWLLPVKAAGKTVEIHGRMAEDGGWTPTDISVKTGEPLHLRLTSDDVMHSFALGQSDEAPLDVKPGQFTETTLVFDQPGKYVFYCTRWCGVNHWRMRGTIEVTGDRNEPNQEQSQPLYVELGLDIDAEHPAGVTPQGIPSARRGEALEVAVPSRYLNRDAYRGRSPAETWEALRRDPFTKGLSDEQVWDLVAWIWLQNTTPQSLETGRELYGQNCAACHGETGSGDGVMAEALTASQDHQDFSHDLKAPTDFTDPKMMLGASPALLQGKILRGGMGTGMPYWGPVFTEDQVWALVDYLWSFQFQNGE